MPGAAATCRTASSNSVTKSMRYLEYINLDPAGRRAPDIARAWLRADDGGDPQARSAPPDYGRSDLGRQCKAREPGRVPARGDRFRGGLPRGACVPGERKGGRRTRVAGPLQIRKAGGRRGDVSAQLHAGRVRRFPASLTRHRQRLVRTLLESDARGSEGPNRRGERADAGILDHIPDPQPQSLTEADDSIAIATQRGRRGTDLLKRLLGVDSRPRDAPRGPIQDYVHEALGRG